MTVTRFVGTGSFLIRISNGAYEINMSPITEGVRF